MYKRQKLVGADGFGGSELPRDGAAVAEVATLFGGSGAAGVVDAVAVVDAALLALLLLPTVGRAAALLLLLTLPHVGPTGSTTRFPALLHRPVSSGGALLLVSSPNEEELDDIIDLLPSEYFLSACRRTAPDASLLPRSP